jgi:hypothetical protein
MQEITFKAQADAVRAALDVVKIIVPPGVTDQSVSGFLFVIGKKRQRIRDKNPDGTPGPMDGKPGPKDGEDRCFVYSRDGLHAARAEFPIYDVEGEGAFVYLANHIDSFKWVESGSSVTFNVKSDPDNNVFLVRWGYSDTSTKRDAKDDATTERSTFDPRLLASLDKYLEATTGHAEYCKAPLEAAIKAGKGYLSDESDRNAKDEYKILNIYDSTMTKDGKGDGTLHATDGYQRIYFGCENFKGKGLQIHSQHLGLVESFLSKCGSKVVICSGTDMTYAMTPEEDCVFGWSKHTKPPLEYKSIPKSWDKVVLLVNDRDRLINQLNWINSEMQKGRDKIRIEYRADAGHLKFYIHAGAKTCSLPIDVTVPVGPDGQKVHTQDFANDVNINQLIRLFKDVKAKEVEFRMFLMEEHGGPKGGAGFRTVDEFWLDQEGKTVGGSGANPDPANGQVFQCKVTRFMPSKQ